MAFAPHRAISARGFSLAEVLIMVLVLVVAMAIAVPMLGSTNYSVARAGARRLASDLQFAQDSAITTQKDVTVTFDVNRESYWLSNASGVLIHPITNGAYMVDFRAIKELSHLDIAKVSGGATVVFDTSGVPNVGSTVALTAGDNTFYVTVSAVTGTVNVAAEE